MLKLKSQWRRPNPLANSAKRKSIAKIESVKGTLKALAASAPMDRGILAILNAFFVATHLSFLQIMWQALKNLGTLYKM